eukprot:COSAG06_NODE_5751_length_3293_cov_2.735128_2_plen_76_part_00
MLGVQAGSANFTLLQRHGMWEFYLGGFLALPERMATAPSCMEIVAQVRETHTHTHTRARTHTAFPLLHVSNTYIR